MFQPEPQPYQVMFNFKVERRISWEGEIEEFRKHLDDVCEALEQDEHVREYGVKARMDEAALDLEVVVPATSQEDAEAVACDVVGKAIRESGGFHIGLLPLKEESQAKSKLNAWAGLRTPRWQQRRLEAIKV